MFATELQVIEISNLGRVIARSEATKQSRLNFRRLPRPDKSGLAMTKSVVLDESSFAGGKGKWLRL